MLQLKTSEPLLKYYPSDPFSQILSDKDKSLQQPILTGYHGYNERNVHQARDTTTTHSVAMYKGFIL